MTDIDHQRTYGMRVRAHGQACGVNLWPRLGLTAVDQLGARFDRLVAEIAQRMDASADAIPGLKNADAQPSANQLTCGRHARHSRADHEDVTSMRAIAARSVDACQATSSSSPVRAVSSAHTSRANSSLRATESALSRTRRMEYLVTRCLASSGSRAMCADRTSSSPRCEAAGF